MEGDGWVCWEQAPRTSHTDGVLDEDIQVRVCLKAVCLCVSVSYQCPSVADLMARTRTAHPTHRPATIQPGTAIEVEGRGV